MVKLILPETPVREATTATGDTYHSDGRILVLALGETEGEKELLAKDTAVAKAGH